MDHKTFLTTLAPDIKNRLTAKQNRAGLRHLAAHLTLILFTGTLIALRVPFWPAILLPHGILLVFLFTLEHEATHKTPFANRPLNEFIGQAIGLIIFLPFEWFRYFHLAHHRHTNIPEKDPELLAGAKPETWIAYIKHLSGLPYWAAMIRKIFTNAFGRAHADFIPKTAHPRIQSEARWMLLLYLFAGLSLIITPQLFWLWIAPLILGQPFLRLFLLAEHGHCNFVVHVFENTRTTYTNRVVRFLSWNMPYHVEHHLMPRVPFHNLPQLHQLTQTHLRVTENGYTRFTIHYIETFSETKTD